MNTDNKPSRVGILHKKSRQTPVHQSDAEPHDTSVPEKPDFDEKDQNISPKRKAPGPGKRRRARATPTAGDAARGSSNQRPEADIKDDQNP